MTNIKQLRSAIKGIVAKGIEEAQGERAQFAHLVGECQDCARWVPPQDCQGSAALDQIRRDGFGCCLGLSPVDAFVICWSGERRAYLATASDYGCKQWNAKA